MVQAAAHGAGPVLFQLFGQHAGLRPQPALGEAQVFLRRPLPLGQRSLQRLRRLLAIRLRPRGCGEQRIRLAQLPGRLLAFRRRVRARLRRLVCLLQLQHLRLQRRHLRLPGLQGLVHALQPVPLLRPRAVVGHHLLRSGRPLPPLAQLLPLRLQRLLLRQARPLRRQRLHAAVGFLRQNQLAPLRLRLLGQRRTLRGQLLHILRQRRQRRVQPVQQLLRPVGGFCQRRKRCAGQVDQPGRVRIARHRLLARLLRLRKALAQAAAELLVDLRAEYAPEDLRPVLALGVEDAQKVALGDHADLRELVLVQPDQRPHRRRHRRGLDHHLTGIQTGQLRVVLLFHDAAAPPRRALVVGIPAQQIRAPRMLERQFHIGLRVRRGEVAAKGARRAPLPSAAGHAVQRECDGVEHRGLARARVAGHQKQPAAAQPAKIHLLHARKRAKPADLQLQGPHAFPSSPISANSCSSTRMWRGVSSLPGFCIR